jgi:hypothetical protein
VMRPIRGEDGRLCYDLMRFGRIVAVKTAAARVWTVPRALQRDGSLARAAGLRLRNALRQFHILLRPMPLHNTKTSLND